MQQEHSLYPGHTHWHQISHQIQVLKTQEVMSLNVQLMIHDDK